jgi:sulfur carrier protein
VTDTTTHITVRLNDTERELPDGTTCRDIVAAATGRTVGDDGRPLDGAGLGVAVAVDGAVVPRSAWASTPLRTGSTVEIVTAVQGG